MKIKFYTKLFLAVILISSINGYAQNKIDSINRLINNRGNDTIKVKLLLQNTVPTYNLFGLKKAIPLSEKALHIADSLDYKLGIAKYHRVLGLINIYESNIDDAIINYKKSLDTYISINNYEGTFECYNAFGVIYYTIGDFGLALDYFQKSLFYANKNQDKKGAAKAYSNIGRLYFDLSDYDKALEYYSKALEKTNNNYITANSLSNIGQCYLIKKQYSKAEEYFNNSLKIFNKINETFGKAASHVYLGDLFVEQNNPILAKKHYLKVLSINKNIKNKELNCYSYLGLSKVYNLNQDYNKSNEYALKAFNNSKDINNSNLIKKSALALSKSAEHLGYYKKAFKFNNIYNKFKDSINNKNIIKKMAVSDFKIEAEKEKLEIMFKQKVKDQEFNQKIERQKYLSIILIIIIIGIATLGVIYYLSSKQKKRKNELLLIQQKEIKNQSIILRENNKKLKELNATKDTFFTIISHDLKNPFNTLMGLSKLVIDHPEDYSEEDKVEYFGYIYDSSIKTHKLLLNLLMWAKSQIGAIEYFPEHIQLHHFILKSISIYEEKVKLKNLTIELNISKNIEVFADKNMLEIVIRNLISNAIKFTPNNGIINIKASVSSKDVIVSIQDNGLGIEEEKIPFIFDIIQNKSTNGTNNEKGSGLGLLLCKEFVTRNQGNIWIESKKQIGTSVFFTIPNFETVSI